MQRYPSSRQDVSGQSTLGLDQTARGITPTVNSSEGGDNGRGRICVAFALSVAVSLSHPSITLLDFRGPLTQDWRQHLLCIVNVTKNNLLEPAAKFSSIWVMFHVLTLFFVFTVRWTSR